jgi:hypothetical protein
MMLGTLQPVFGDNSGRKASLLNCSACPNGMSISKYYSRQFCMATAAAHSLLFPLVKWQPGKLRLGTSTLLFPAKRLRRLPAAFGKTKQLGLMACGLSSSWMPCFPLPPLRMSVPWGWSPLLGLFLSGSPWFLIKFLNLNTPPIGTNRSFTLFLRMGTK